MIVTSRPRRAGRGASGVDGPFVVLLGVEQGGWSDASCGTSGNRGGCEGHDDCGGADREDCHEWCGCLGSVTKRSSGLGSRA